MTVIHVNPCRPFTGMARQFDFLEILSHALAKGFGLSSTCGLLVDEAIHHAYQKHETVIMRDIVEEVWTLRERFGEPAAFEVCALFNCMIDDAYAEYQIFCERDGIAMNDLDLDGMRAVYRQASNGRVRAFIEIMLIHALMF